MPRKQGTAAKKARARQATEGTRYLRALRETSQPPAAAPPVLAQSCLREVVGHLKELGWGADDTVDLEFGNYEVYAGAALLQAVRDVEDGGVDVDPDDPLTVDITAPVHLTAASPPGDRYVDDFEFGAFAGAEPPQAMAARLDRELGRARLRRVHGVEAESTVPCPICADRYPAGHLLANCPGADPTCPACVFDGDQRYRTDLPYLAVRIDDLLSNDLAAPAGWSGVATLLGLVCGANLGRRLQSELSERRGFPVVLERWHDPMGRSWIWLPPPEERHEAFGHLGAGATIGALTDALVRHVPTLEQQAKTVVRRADVVWRASLLPAAVAYAVAFSTQAFERDRHRKPVHVVDSTADGLSLIMEPFGVTGEAANVEYGVQELLEELLFPLLLGHGLYDEPVDPRRAYGAAEDDDRPARTRQDARLSHETDRAAQVAVVLGRYASATPAAEILWEGAADPTLDTAGLGITSPVDARIAEIREQARLHAAGAAFDDGGPLTMTADQTWIRAGCWIPADHAPHAVRQAHDFLTEDLRVEVLWAGPLSSWPEPQWVVVEIVEVNAHSTGPIDAPWLRVADAFSVFGIMLSDIGLLRRAAPDTTLSHVHGT